MSETRKSSLFLEIDPVETYENKGFQQFSPEAMLHQLSPLSPSTNDNNYNLCDDIRVISLAHEMENMNDEITNKCILHEESNKIGMGSSSNIYKISGNPNSYIKISNLPYDSYMLAKKTPHGITCETIGDRLNVSLNEITNSLKYGKLSLVFPHNIMKIESAEKCKKDYSGLPFFANQFLIEKIDGFTLDKAIELMTENELLCSLIQILYILSYANMHGYFHNDITSDNIMIYYGNVTNIIFNKLFLFDNIVLCNIVTNDKMKSMPIVKLIDFSYSEYINYNKIEEMNEKVVIGEPQQILKMIKNKLNRMNSELKNSKIFNQMCSLFDLLNKGNPVLKFRYSELDAQISSMGFRTLTETEIIEMAISKNFAETTLLKCFTDLQQSFVESPNYGIHIEILNTAEKLKFPYLVKKTLKNSAHYIKSFGRTTLPNKTQLPEIQDKYKKYAVKTNNLLNDFHVQST